ncbi:MAG: Tex-like N-terminal domain-containing protein [Campylobacterota bacterium]|nr:Tex-like N-terminal domain-containing protein [Campylobacterota bacterium]
MQELIAFLIPKTTLSQEQITNILILLDEGSTIPFIARYRKEMTGSADDEKLREFETLYLSAIRFLERRDEIRRLISDRGVLSESIEQSIRKAESLSTLEDIYRPFKEKRSSRASTAIAEGLTPLSTTLSRATLTTEQLRAQAQKILKGKVTSVDEAIRGAQDILAERYAELPREREAIRNSMLKFGVLEVKRGRNFQEDGLFKNFVSKAEKVAHIPSHRYLAIMRGVKERELSAKITIDTSRIEAMIKQYKIPRDAASSQTLLFDAYRDGLKRLLLPSLEREVHTILKERSDQAAISVFGRNLHQLLMTPPVSKRVILGVDPAFRTGCKLAVIDEQGNYLDHAVVYPTAPKRDYEGSKSKVLALAKKYHITGVAIGNGTGSQETQAFFAKLNREEGADLGYTVISEAGASVYSASKIAMQEYPHLDVTIRGAISIAQRLRDPMAALVKIDPKSLGIGQYQHDVDQKKLAKKLSAVTEDLVNHIGVDINSASLSLLVHIAGITPRVAQNIIDYREGYGDFTTKDELLKVKGIGKKSYEQAAGFIRIKDGKRVLDNSGIHPESYMIASELEGLDLDTIDSDALAQELHVGVETLRDIIRELQKPGFDPREELPAIPFKEGMTDISMLREGSFISGIVRNIADFGAFVDIGLKNDGMIHISKMSSRRIKHPLEVLSINQYLPLIEVVSIDRERGKIGLSLV